MATLSPYGTFFGLADRQEEKTKMEEPHSRSGDSHKMIGTVQLAVIVFYTVAGTFL